MACSQRTRGLMMHAVDLVVSAAIKSATQMPSAPASEKQTQAQGRRHSNQVLRRRGTRASQGTHRSQSPSCRHRRGCRTPCARTRGCGAPCSGSSASRCVQESTESSRKDTSTAKHKTAPPEGRPRPTHAHRNVLATTTPAKELLTTSRRAQQVTHSRHKTGVAAQEMEQRTHDTVKGTEPSGASW